MQQTWPKSCEKCGAEWTIDEWELLHYIGVTEAARYGFDGDIEYRRCGSCNAKIKHVPIMRRDVIEV